MRCFASGIEGGADIAHRLAITLALCSNRPALDRCSRAGACALPPARLAHSRMNQRTFRSLVLALSLVLAQAMAAAHVLSHIGEQPESGKPLESCRWCLSCAHLLDDAAPPTAASTAATVPPVPFSPGVLPAGVILPAWLAYRSQAPPPIS